MNNRVSAWAVILTAVMWSSALGCAGARAEVSGAAQPPQLPRELVDTSMPVSKGRVIKVPAGGDFQEALEEAQLGDTIVLQAGVIYRGPFTLPEKKTGAGWITIRSNIGPPQLPPPGTRVHPSHASLMPKLVASRGFVVSAEKRAHHYRFIGIEMAPTEDTFLYGIVSLGNNRERAIEDLPHHIVIDRSYLHGDAKKGSRRGVAMNGRHQAVIDSYLSDFKEEVHDTQAVGGWAGSGPFKIVNNFLEASGENICIGGGDPNIRDLVPSDIEIRQNYSTKPLNWKPEEPNYDGSQWRVKFLFELKNARRVLIDGNIFEYNWQTPGYGFGVVFTVRNQEGTAPWSVIEDVTFTNNIVRHAASGLNILGFDDHHPNNEPTRRILIKNNVFEDIGGPRWGGRGRLFQLLRGTQDVVIEHNIAAQTGDIVVADGEPHQHFVYRYNISPHNDDGITGAGTGVGEQALSKYFPNALVAHNVIIGGDARKYPDKNYFPDSTDAAKVAGLSNGEYRVSPSSPYKARGADEDPGVDIRALCAALGSNAGGEKTCKTAAHAGPAQ